MPAPETWLVAVDDDPTGCQSVSGVPLLTSWDDETLARAARRRAPVTFVLTNSRSMAEPDAVRVNHEVGAALARAAVSEGRQLRLISRSDSTLRGHFPAEVDALVDGAEVVPDAIVICPAFFEAGRFTADGIHWVHSGGELVPACRTEFAADATFGFDELTLAEWVRARGAPAEVIDIGLGELSRGDVDAVVNELRAARGGQAVVVNATNYDHLRVFFRAAERMEADGRVLVYRTGPSFVRAAAGLGPPPLAEVDTVGARTGEGLVVVGSHTEVTNTQVDHLRATHGPREIELDAEAVVDDVRRDDHIAETVTATVGALTEGTTLLQTSRAVLTARGDRTSLEMAGLVAAALTETVRRVSEVSPLAWVVAKGGITSHELLSTAFSVQAAEVLGQALPGIIPVLEITIGDRRVPYVIFPGNVGDETTMSMVVDRLAR